MEKQINNLFELSWSWYEDYQTYLFYHQNKTEGEFKNDIRFLLRKYGKDYIESEKPSSWVMAPEWIEFISKKMPELGYVPAKIINENFWGAYIIDGDLDDFEEKNWKEAVGEELYKEAVDHNRSIRD
jgi:hypothetical protein